MVCTGLGPEDVSLLERCSHFRGWYVQVSMELGTEDVSLLGRCPRLREWYLLSIEGYQMICIITLLDTDPSLATPTDVPTTVDG